MNMFRAGVGFGLLLAAASSLANTFTVTTTADSGAGSLRQAILDANANAGADTIAFNIAGSGVHTITLASLLAPLTSPVTIDGYTQSGASANTQPFGQGLNTVLRIQVTGGAGVGTCFTVQASDTTIKGLVVNGCTTSVDIQSGSNNRVEGNFMGTDPTGTQRLVDGGNQVFVGNAPSARVGRLHSGRAQPDHGVRRRRRSDRRQQRRRDRGQRHWHRGFGRRPADTTLRRHDLSDRGQRAERAGHPQRHRRRRERDLPAGQLRQSGARQLRRHGRDGHGGPGPLAERHGRLRDESRHRGQLSWETAPFSPAPTSTRGSSSAAAATSSRGTSLAPTSPERSIWAITGWASGPPVRTLRSAARIPVKATRSPSTAEVLDPRQASTSGDSRFESAATVYSRTRAPPATAWGST